VRRTERNIEMAPSFDWALVALNCVVVLAGTVSLTGLYVRIRRKSVRTTKGVTVAKAAGLALAGWVGAGITFGSFAWSDSTLPLLVAGCGAASFELCWLELRTSELPPAAFVVGGALCVAFGFSYAAAGRVTG
jgi:hypothetical protein